jgi:hypothetical protein
MPLHGWHVVAMQKSLRKTAHSDSCVAKKRHHYAPAAAAVFRPGQASYQVIETANAARALAAMAACEKQKSAFFTAFSKKPADARESTGSRWRRSHRMQPMRERNSRR